MDTIALAIMAAVTAGAASGVTQVGQQFVVDAYKALKAKLKSRFGEESEVVKAVEQLEKKPDSAGRKASLKEELQSAQADQDADLRQLAQALLEKITAQPNGAQIVQQATGNYIAQANNGSTATVNVNTPKP